jgi:hypothetical protein
MESMNSLDNVNIRRFILISIPLLALLNIVAIAFISTRQSALQVTPAEVLHRLEEISKQHQMYVEEYNRSQK